MEAMSGSVVASAVFRDGGWGGDGLVVWKGRIWMEKRVICGLFKEKGLVMWSQRTRYGKVDYGLCVVGL